MLFLRGFLQVVSRNPEPLRSRDSTDSVQGELLPGEEQPDLQERLLAITQVDTRTLTWPTFGHSLVHSYSVLVNCKTTFCWCFIVICSDNHSHSLFICNAGFSQRGIYPRVPFITVLLQKWASLWSMGGENISDLRPLANFNSTQFSHYLSHLMQSLNW